MNLQLRSSRSHRSQRRDSGDLAGAQIEARAAVDVAKWKLEHVVCEVGGDVPQSGYDIVAGRAVDFSERPLAAFQPAFAGVRGLVRHGHFSSVPCRHIRQSWCRGR